MKRLMMYLKDYKKESILAPLFKLLEAFFELMVPLVMANIIDYGAGSAPARRSRTGFLHYGAVFRSQGSSGGIHQTAAGIV